MKYIADRLKTSTFFGFCLALAMAVLVSCSDNSTEDPDLKKYKNRFCGEYQYTSAIWTGGDIDLDGEGTGHKDLDEEFRGCSGYDNNLASAEVTYDDSEEMFQVNAIVPFYAANESDGKIDPVGIIYEYFILKAQWMDMGTDGEFFVSEYFIENQVNPIPDIIDIEIASVTDDSFEMHVICSLYDQQEGKLVEGTVIFTFTK
jgi:hypothetical protein